MMIVYCGLRHFYIRHYKASHAAKSGHSAFYILTHNEKVWDFSPELKDQGFTGQAKPQSVLHLDIPVISVPIALSDFASCAEDWHRFSRQYTEELEIEYPHAWYLRFSQPAIFKQFILDFSQELELKEQDGIWGAGQSKLVAKLAAHNRGGAGRIVPPGQTKAFLSQIPLHRLPLPELEALDKLGINSIGELGKIPLPELGSHFGSRTASILHKLGCGEDLVAFQPQQTQEYTWTIDCTALEGFFRPLAPCELKPYLKQGVEKLASMLRDQHKTAGQIKLEACLNQGTYFKKTHQLKQATDDPKVLTRTLESLLPDDLFAQVSIAAGKLEASSHAQLAMFWEPQTPKIMDDNLTNCAQIGIELPRRERLLMLWEECFS